MNKVILLLFIISNSAFGQNFLWVKTGGGTLTEKSNYVVSDASGNAYVTGRFQGTAIFSGQTLTSTGIHDFYIAKYSPFGTLLWIKEAGSTSAFGKIEGKAVSVSSTGDVYVTGFFDSTINFGNGVMISANGNQIDIFVAKYNSTGIIQWAISCGGSEQDYVDDIVVDASGNSYITGQFRGNSQFGSYNVTSLGWMDVFLAKLNSSGTFQWVKRGGGVNRDASYGIAFDNSNNPVITGSFENTAMFGGIGFSTTGIGSFILKYDANGSELSGIQSTGNIDGVWPTDITILPSNDIYISGFFYNTVQFGSITLISNGNTDCFLAKSVNLSGWQWVKTGGSTTDDVFNSITMDFSGNILAAGYFGSSATFSGITLNSSGSRDIVLCRYLPDGSISWGMGIGGTGSDYGEGIFSSGIYTYLTGSTYGANFPIGINATSNGLEDMFIGRLDTNLISGIINNTSEHPEEYSLHQNYPNPFNPTTKIRFTLPISGLVKLTVYDILGRQVSELVNQSLGAGSFEYEFDGSGLTSGIYFYRLEAGDFVETKRMILLK